MTQDQCSEVATVIWGFTFVNGNFFDEKGQWYSNAQDIGVSVDSWRGFGRTIEALMSRDMKHTVAVLLYDAAKNYETPEKLIESFQTLSLSALEALSSKHHHIAEKEIERLKVENARLKKRIKGGSWDF